MEGTMRDPKDDYRSTLHAVGWRLTQEAKLTHPAMPGMVDAMKRLKAILSRIGAT